MVEGRDVQYLITHGSSERRVGEGVVGGRRFDERDEHRRLLEIELRRVHRVVTLRRRFNAVSLRTEVDRVEIPLEDLILREFARELASVDDLVDLALDRIE